FFIDTDGYECEIFGAAINQITGTVAYIESRAQEQEKLFPGFEQKYVDVSIKIHIDNMAGHHKSIDIKSYNPYFGCDLRFFDWIGDSVLLIYQEKHSVIACRFGDIWPPRFVKIEDRWLLKDSVLAYIGYKNSFVQRLSVPELDELESISI